MEKSDKIKTHSRSNLRHAAAPAFVHTKAEQGFFAPAGRHAQTTAFIQPKLTISQPGDPYEREADAMADHVMRSSEPAPVAAAAPAAGGNLGLPDDNEDLQRKEEAPEEEMLQPKLFVNGSGSLVQRSEDKDEEPIQAKAAEGRNSLWVNSHGSLIQRSEDEEEGAVQAKEEEDEPLQAKSEKILRQETGNQGRAPPAVSPRFTQQLQSHSGAGKPIESGTRQFMESRFQSDFSQVRIHQDARAADLSRSIHAQAFTHGRDIYFSPGRYNPDTGQGKHLLAHELTHTIQQGATSSVRPFLSVQQKTSIAGALPPSHAPPLQRQEEPSKEDIADNDTLQARQENIPASEASEDLTVQAKTEPGTSAVRPELRKAVAYAQSQVGKVDAAKKDADGNRVGWQRLVEYFKSAMGDDKVIPPGGVQKQGSILEENIRVKGKPVMAQKPNQNDPKVQEARDAMPSWCGIFVFWSLNKGGVPMPKWTMGGNAVKLKAAYSPSYIPRPGDIAYYDTNSHYAIVEKTEPENPPASERKNVKVRTVNGNTAGEDNLGGQVQVKSHAVSHWAGFFNPLYGIEDKMPKDPAELTDAELQQIAGAAASESSAPVAPSGPAPVKPYEGATPPAANQLLTPPAVVSPEEGTVPAPEEGEAAKEKAPEAPVEMAPKTPEEDPAFQKVLKAAGSAKKQQEKHDLPESKQVAAQNASEVPKDLDINSQAQYHQVGAMNAQEPQAFSEQAFKDQLRQRIEAALPKDDNETIDRYENKEKGRKKMEEARTGMKTDVASEKQKAGNAISSTAAAPPNTALAVPKPVAPMAPEDAGKQPYVPDAQTAAPKPKTDGEISMEKDAAALDDQMAENKVTEAQLEKSNEPAFTGALENKRTAQEEARKAPEEYRAQEKPQLAKAEKDAQGNVMGTMAAMHGARSGLFGKVDTSKTDTKSKDETKRKEIADKLQSIYNSTKTAVEEKLNKLETTVTDEFDKAATAANTIFEKHVNDRLDDHYGITTIDDTVSEFFSGLSPEIDRIFREEKQIFMDSMDTTINSIAKTVATELNAAIQLIKDGKKEVDTYWNSLDPEMQKIGEAAKTEITGKFEELEQTVHDKHEQLVEKLSQKYVDNVTKLEETFNKIKDSKKGWLSGAFDAIAGVIKTIIELAEMLFDTLIRVAQVIGSIIEDPIGFLGNLVSAVKLGLSNFIGNLALHLKKGLFEWLLGAMPPGIQFPDKWDLTGIFTFVMQIIGLTWSNIRMRAVKKLGEPVVAALEEVFEIFQIIRKEGLAGLWKYIKEKVGDLQVLIIDAIKNYIMEKVIMAGIEWVIGLLNPVGAFIKACKAIYSIVKFFIEKGKQIMEFVNTVIDSIALIVAGNISTAALWVENALAKLIPLVIGFLASLLGLGDIAAKVQKIIEAIQKPINKAIDWVLDKAIAFAKKLGIDKVAKKVKGGVDQTKKWAKDKAAKGKEKVKEVAAKVLDWLGIRKPFSLKNGQKHEIYFASKENPNAKVTIASDPLTLEAILAAGKWMGKVLPKKTLKVLDTEGKAIDALRPKQNVANGKLIQGHFTTIASELTKATGVDVPATVAKSTGSRGAGTKLMGEKLNVKPLSLNPGAFSGSPPTVDSEMGEELKLRYPGMFVAGHLLNDNLHGPGNQRWNLVPLTQKANSDMKTKVEGPIKKKVLSEGAVVNMTVDVAYKSSSIDETLPTYPEGQMPDSVKVVVEEMAHDGTDWAVASPQPAWAAAASKTIPNDTRNIVGFGGAKPLVINLNTSDEYDLARLAYIGPERAKKIADYRVKANLPAGRTKFWFMSVDELLNVPGIGQATVDAIKADSKKVSFRF